MEDMTMRRHFPDSCDRKCPCRSDTLKCRIQSQTGKIVGLKINFENEQAGGNIDSLSELKKLEYLNIRNNQMTGQLTADIANLRQLKHLIAPDNNIDGTIP